MAITSEMVRNLREKTGAGMMECKKALTEAEGNEEKAIEILRKSVWRAPRSGKAEWLPRAQWPPTSTWVVRLAF